MRFTYQILQAFFLPTDRYNERYEELSAHPDWSFHGKDFPSNAELQEARNRVMSRHPRTKFVALHVSDSENLPYVAECLDRYPNMYVDIAARMVSWAVSPEWPENFLINTRTEFCLPRTPRLMVTKLHSRFLETSCTDLLPFSRD